MPTQVVASQVVVSPQRVSPNAVQALKEALVAAFWYKRDLRAYLTAAVRDTEVLRGIDWEGYKREIVDSVVDAMVTHPERYHELLLQLMIDVAAMEDFPKLRRHEDAERLTREATDAVAALRKVITPYERELLEQEQAKATIRLARERAEQRRAVNANARLDVLKGRYLELLATDDARARGYALESLLRDLFAAFDLDPRAAFRALDGNNFLLEAKWTGTPTPRAELDAFAAKIADKIENTLGLFISVNGFERTAIVKHSGKGTAMILMDGGDLYAVLEQRIDLDDLLRRKYRHAAQTGEILLPVNSILG
jgi:hypothetical protein